MGIAPGLNTHQKKEQSGAPFAAGAANNGVSVDATTGKIVLGNNNTAVDVIAQLLSNRLIPLGAFSLKIGSFTDNISFGVSSNNGALLGGTKNSSAYFNFQSWNFTGGAIPGTEITVFDLTGVFEPSTGGNTVNSHSVSDAFNPTGGNGQYNGFNASTSLNASGWSGILTLFHARPAIIANTGTVRGFYYESALGLTSGTIIAFGNLDGNNTFNTGTASKRGGTGFNGVTSPTARVHIGAGDGVAGRGQLKLDAGTILAGPEAGVIETNGTNLFYTDATATRYTLAKILTASATLDFPNTAANGQSDLTVNVPGAALSDVVAIGVSAASATIGTFWGFVSAANTVTVRFHNTSGGAVDPASGTFKIAVTKF